MPNTVPRSRNWQIDFLQTKKIPAHFHGRDSEI